MSDDTLEARAREAARSLAEDYLGTPAEPDLEAMAEEILAAFAHSEVVLALEEAARSANQGVSGYRWIYADELRALAARWAAETEQQEESAPSGEGEETT